MSTKSERLLSQASPSAPMEVRQTRRTPGFVTTPERSHLMSRVRQKDTPAELRVRRLLHASGYRFRLRGKGLPGTPDIVNRKHRWAIFVHGCFWHAHEGCQRWRVPKKNCDTWEQKFAANRERDRRAVSKLEARGYRVLVVWECELKNEAALIRRLLGFLGPARPDQAGEHIQTLPSAPWVARTVAVSSSSQVSVYPLAVEADTDDPAGALDLSFLRSPGWPVWSDGGESVRTADLFAGCGGLSLGAREACSALGRPFEPLFALDKERSALTVYETNFSPAHALGDDIRSVLDGSLGEPPTDSERRWRNALGEVHLLLAGPPCQGHSDLNNQTRRDDPRNGLYARVARFAEIFQPGHILIENVPAVVHGKDRALDTTVSLLSVLGYHVDTEVVDLLSLGVPQRRRRHVVLASRSKPLAIQSIVEKYSTRERTLRWAIGDLEDEEGSSAFSAASVPSPENLERILYLQNNDRYDLPNELRPACHRDGNHSYKSMYGRLRWDEPAQTITSGFGSPGQGRYIHPDQPRTLTPHEAARLQCFPDSFDFSGVEYRTHLAQMIGNAVPMKISYVFCLELLR